MAHQVSFGLTTDIARRPSQDRFVLETGLRAADKSGPHWAISESYFTLRHRSFWVFHLRRRSAILRRENCQSS